jgi:hypothetical protein
MRAPHRTGAGPALLVALLAAALGGACSAALSRKISPPNATREFSAAVGVHGEKLTLHLTSPRTPPPASMPIIVYASGDGGWFGTAVGMFHTLAGTGLPAVGFSTKAFMHIEQRAPGPLSVARVAEGYQRIIDASLAHLGLPPDAPVILTGWSRGASLGVLVTSSREADPRVIGLVGVGLAADEQLDIEGDSDDDAGTRTVPAVDNRSLPERSIAMYPLLSRIAPRRVVVIQATGDAYLPATRARDLFGSDSTSSRLVAIDARNHRFSGGESAFAAALVNAVDWIRRATVRDQLPLARVTSGKCGGSHRRPVPTHQPGCAATGARLDTPDNAAPRQD